MCPGSSILHRPLVHEGDDEEDEEHEEEKEDEEDEGVRTVK
jgi:hypothetical protein